MTQSSGQYVIERTETRRCDECGFTGPVDVWRDPEVSRMGWTCPECGEETDEQMESEQ